MVKHSRGFTLVELMIVVAVLGVLVAIAYPSYQESIRNTKRVETQAELLELAKRLQRYKIANFNYMKVDAGGTETEIELSDVGHNGNLPNTGTALYTVTLSDVDLSSWTLIATPKAGTIMAGNGVICLNSQGHRFWQKGATTCALSATSTWDK